MADPQAIETHDTVVLEPNGFYDPSCWPGLDTAPYMQLPPGTRIRQQPIYGTDRQLIAPWDMQRVLRPGTLVIAQCSFVMWNWNNKSVTPSGNEHKYQLKLSRLDVVDYSMCEFESHMPVAATPSSSSYKYVTPPSAPPPQFGPPQKRRKLE
ncbi:hypothetical protein SISNIDRAFT_467708 [Sistotremastrum niveocremeum HHB9708]|uniref:Uncharacterized protein n=1 Tax=Sistotremastrum niveocremeum HHB9708 TaxID=1314777 RepID=A0A164SGQ3_9AGAM|nr:hypothetical protein SISNIDRAFT_467708 [Sistotremastrum niveocremeum HHB9708]